MLTTSRPSRPAHRARLGVEPLEDRATPTASSITASFNATPIPGGDTVWFSSVGKVSGLGAGTTSLHLNGGTVSFTAGTTAYSVAVPNTTVTFTPLATKATTTYSSSGWLVTAPPKFSGNVFLGGAALPVAAGLPGGIKNVTWQTNVTADAPKVSVSWKWGAAVYTSFGGSLDAVGAKAVDDMKVDAFKNNDPAGTPENFKAFVVRGATGTGGMNFTGGSSASKSVAAGPYVPPALGSLAGTVFQDADGGHNIDPNDFRFEGMVVDLRDANGMLITSTTTGPDGTFTFANLAAGTYEVEIVPDPVYNSMLPAVGSSGGTVDPSWALITDIALGSGTTATGYNFGVWASGS
jgi:SdrD B-like domain